MPAKPKKGDVVRVLVGSAERIVGRVVRNNRHLPNPYQVEVDLNASAFPDEEARAYFESHYAGPYRADELEVLGCPPSST